MILSDLEGVGYRVLNTDAQALIQSQAQQRLQLGQTLTRGLGAGGNPTIGQKAAEESRTDLHDALQGSDLVFIAAGTQSAGQGLPQLQPLLGLRLDQGLGIGVENAVSNPPQGR